MQRNRLAIALLAVLLAFVAATANAQGGRGSNSGFSGGLSSGFGGIGGVSSGLGGMGGMSGGMSGMSGLGGMGGGMSGLGSSGMGGFGGNGFGSSGFGSSGFGQSGTGLNQQGGQNFVGRDSSDMSAIFNQLGRNSNQFFQQLNRTMGRSNRNRGNTSQEENVVLPVRVRLDVAFDHPQVQTTAVAANVRTRLDKVLSRRSIATPNVEVKGDTIVLRGVAPSESQRLVIEKLVSLEPGVLAVDNQMTVAQQPSATPLLPPQADN